MLLCWYYEAITVSWDNLMLYIILNIGKNHKSK